LYQQHRDKSSKATLILVVQTAAFKLNPDTGGTNSRFLNQSLCCWYKLPLSKSTSYAGGANSYITSQSLSEWY